jgi:hypothetical protein
MYYDFQIKLREKTESKILTHDQLKVRELNSFQNLERWALRGLYCSAPALQASPLENHQPALLAVNKQEMAVQYVLLQTTI